MHGLDTKRFHWRGWFGIVLLVPAGALAVLSRPLVAEGTAANVLVDVLAWAAFVCGACFRLWATLYVGGQKGLSLVTEGPYSLSRNPLYLGSFLLAVSVALFLKSLTSLVAVVLAGAGYAAFTIPAEERYLLRQFGEAYRV